MPHVHVHIIPRRKLDYKENDEIYDQLEQSERNLKATFSYALPTIEDKDRAPRTDDDMATEVAWLANFFD